MKLDLIQDLPQLVEIETEWNSLVERCPDSTPFQLPRWLLTWWKHFASGSLHVLVLRAGEDRLVGVVPCFIHEWQSRRQITLLGSGVSDYLDPPIELQYRAEALELLDKHLDDFTGWDVCNWQDLSACTPLKKLKNATVIPEVQTSAIPLGGNFERFWRSVSKDLRRNVRRYAKRAREVGSLDFHAGKEHSPQFVDALIQLHAERWEKQGERGMIAVNHSEPFLRDVLCRLSENGLAQFFVLRFKGEMAAIILVFPFKQRIFAYMTGFDPKYENLGFGRLLLYEALSYADAQGFESWDFLRGDEPYKSMWRAVPSSRCRLIIERSA